MKESERGSEGGRGRERETEGILCVSLQGILRWPVKAKPENMGKNEWTTQQPWTRLGTPSEAH